MAVTTSRPSHERFDDPAFYLGDPHETLARLRREDPVHWYEDGTFWVITKYDDVRFISRRPDLFSSANIAILGDIIKIREKAPRPPRDSVLFMDPPEHRAHRKVMSGELTPGSVNMLEAAVREVVKGALEPLGDDAFDAITAVAEPIPVNVFSSLLGVPREDWRRMIHWSTVISSSGGGGESPETMAAVYAELVPYLEDLLEQRRQAPGSDYLSIIARAEVDGEPLTALQVVWWAISLLAAGSETTQALIAGLLYAFALSPEQAQRVFEDPSLVRPAVEETLRWWTPVVSMARQATTDVELGGTQIRAGDAVLLVYSSANRDEDRWGEDADEWNVDRIRSSDHVAFGFGEHFCMGAHLARREATVLIEEMAQRWRGVEIDGTPQRRRSNLMTTFDHLPVRFAGRGRD